MVKMIILYILISAICMIPIGIYLYIYIKRTAEFFKIDTKKKRVKISIKVITVVIACFCINIWSKVALVIFHVLALALCMELITWILKVAVQKRTANVKKSVWNSIYRSGLVPIVGTAIILSYGYFNIRNIVDTSYSIHTEKDIREEGYRVAMIADLHYGTVMDKEELKKNCDKIQSTSPDMVVLCGDIVEESTTLEEMNEAMEVLGNIQSEYGVFYIFGNHDLSTYTSSPNYSEAQLKEAISKNNIKLLIDESYEINDDFVIIGRDDASFMLDNDRTSGEELLENVDKNKFTLLLDHQPIELQENSNLGYDLQLSGHTHAGQIWPVGFVGEALGMIEKNYGYKQINNYQIIVSSGMVGWGYPIRTGSNSEYVIIDINK